LAIIALVLPFVAAIASCSSPQTSSTRAAPAQPTAQATTHSSHGSFRGRILSLDGQPAVGLHLRVIKFGPAGGGMRRAGTTPQYPTPEPRDRDLNLNPWDTVIARIVTDKEGRFRCHDIAPGYYMLVGGSDDLGWVYDNIIIGEGAETVLREARLVKLD
jgi:hypothetical protein